MTGSSHQDRADMGAARPGLQNAAWYSLALFFGLLSFDGIATLKEVLFFSSLAACAAVLARRKGAGLQGILPDRYLVMLMLASLVWSAVSLLTAIDFNYSLNEIIRKMTKQYLLYFLAFGLVSASRDREDYLRWFFIPLIVSTLIMSIAACFQFSRYPVMFNNRVSGFTGEFYRLSVFLVIAVPFAFSSAVAFQGWRRVLSVITLAIAAPALFFTFTRAAWIAVFIEGLIFAFIFLRRYWKAFWIAAIALSLVFILLSALSVIPKILVVHGSEGHRVDAYRHAAQIIKEYPVTGIGYGKKTFSRYFPDIYVKHAHNIFLNTAVETGIPGAVLMVCITALVLKNFIVPRRKGHEETGGIFFSAALASCIGFLVLNQFDYMYHGWPGQMFWITVGMGHALSGTSVASRPAAGVDPKEG